MPNVIRNRKEISSRLNAVRSLRNASMHHHSIWHWRDLKAKHCIARDLISWINQPIHKTLQQVDRFPEVFAAGETLHLKKTTLLLEALS